MKMFRWLILPVVGASLFACQNDRKNGADSNLASISVANLPVSGWASGVLSIKNDRVDREVRINVNNRSLEETLEPGTYTLTLDLLNAEGVSLYSSRNCSEALKASQNHTLVPGPNRVQIFACTNAGDVVNPPLASAEINPVIMTSEAKIMELLQPKCGSCHASGSGLSANWLAAMKSQTANVVACMSTRTTAEAQTRDCIMPNRLAAGLYRSKLTDATLVDPATFPTAASAMMPPGAQAAPFTAEEFELIKNWLLYSVASTISNNNPQVQCTTDIKPALLTHLRREKAEGWKQYHRDQGTPMFACLERDDFPANPLDCFNRAEYPRDASYLAPAADRDNKNISIFKVRELPYQTSYWQRISPDGRFVGNGAYKVEDLAVSGRNINIDFGIYDPAFSPDNRRFMYVSTICSSDLLRDTSRSSVSSAQCQEIQGVGTYQSIGGRPGAENFVVINPQFYDADNVGVTDVNWSDHSDFRDSETDIFQIVPNAQGALTSTRTRVSTQRETQTQISVSSEILIGRYSDARNTGHYNIHFLDDYVSPNYRTNNTDKASRLCMPGTKALSSYDDRFIVTHSMGSNQRKADIMLGDLYTGKTYKITNMPNGAYAVYPHFRADNWIYFQIRDHRSGTRRDSVWATDAALIIEQSAPMP